MRVRIILSIIFLFNFYSSLAQLTIKGNITGFDHNKHIYLGSYIGDKLVPIDSCLILEDGKFEFSIEKDLIHHGLYEISFIESVALPIILSKDTKLLKLKNLSFEDLRQYILPSINIENEALQYLSSKYLEFQKKKEVIISNKKRLNLYNSEHLKDLSILKKKYDSSEIAFNDYLDNFKIKYKGTYAADIISGFFYRIIIPDGEIEEDVYLKEHFFDYWNFNDERIIYNPLINDKFYEYILNYSGLTGTGFNEAINQLMERALRNNKVTEFTLEYLIVLFLEKGPEEVLFYIYDNFIEGCFNQIGNVDINKIKQLRNFKVGMTGKDIESLSPEGKKVVLSSMVEDVPIILYFWATDCDHCAYETPKLLNIYHKFKREGLKIFAVSMDKNKNEWLNYIKNNYLDWINVCDLQGFDGKAAKDYFVFGTPTIFVLDKDLTILYKQPSIDELEIEISKILAK